MRKSTVLMTLLGVIACVGVVGASDDQDTTSPYLIANTRVAPDYPPSAYQARTAGQVTLRATVLADGTVGEVEVVDSTRGGLGFEKAAQRAVDKWRFEPARNASGAIDSTTYVTVSFQPPGSGRSGSVSARFSGGLAEIGPANVAGANAGSRNASTSAGFFQNPIGDLSDVGSPPGVLQRGSQQNERPDREVFYGRPSCGYLGCVYNRERLIPNSSIGNANANLR